MAQSQTREDIIIECGYRPVTVGNEGPPCGLLTYLAFNRNNSTLWLFTPIGGVSWDAFEYDGDNRTCFRHNQFKRSRIAGLFRSSRMGYEWYARIPKNGRFGFVPHLDLVFTSLRIPTVHGLDVRAFIDNEIGGDGPILDAAQVKIIFDRVHPENQNERMLRDLERERAEIEARRAQLSNMEAFAEMYELQRQALQYVDGSYARRETINAAERVRRHVQNCLDNKIPVTRLNPQLPVVTIQLPYSSDPPKPPENGKEVYLIEKPRPRSIILEP